MPDALQSLAVLNKNLVAVKNSPGENVAITGESATLPGASVGAVSEVLLRYAPILDGSGIDIGRAGNTSLLITSAALTREVNQLEDSKLLPGDYWVDYLSGLIHGRCATVSASIIATYKIRRSNTSITGSVTILGTVPVSGTVAVSTLPAITGSVTITGTPTVIATGNVAASVADSGNPVKAGGVYNYVKPNLLTGQRGDLQLETDGSLRVKVTERPLAEDNDLLYSVLATKAKPVTGTKYTYAIDRSVALENFTISAASGTPVNWRMTRWMIDKTMPSGEYFWQTGDYLALPADGAVTLICEPLKVVHYNGIDTYFNIDNLDNCISLTQGLISWLSTTRFTKTLAAGSFGHGTIYYKT